MNTLVDVAVPLPLTGTLIYEVPANLMGSAGPGIRVKVRVGRRQLTGVVLSPRSEPPDREIRLRPIEAVLDRQPVLPGDLLNLAQEVANYYLAPIGEVIRGMLPSDDRPWGEEKIWLSTAGAFSSVDQEIDRQIVELLRVEGRLKISQLMSQIGRSDVPAAIDRLEQKGLVLLSSGGRRGARYTQAVELSPGDKSDLLEASGRSVPGREVVELLAAVGRPMTVTEVCARVGCSPAVVRRLASRGVLRRFTQVSKLSLDHHRLDGTPEPPIVLREDQQAALDVVNRALEDATYRALVLAGMTGSGKTAVYLQAVERVLDEGGSAVILVPEIALVPAIATQARTRFGSRTAILHSGLAPQERQQEWERIRSGEARVVLGPRSAVFAPVRNLRLVVIDEEQDPSYKQDHTPRYHGRDVAVLRAHLGNAVAILVSATPSLETRFNAEVGKMTTLLLTKRVGQGSLPEGVLVDLKQEQVPLHPGEVQISQRLHDEIEGALSRGDQIILLRNRRGYAPMLLCRACGHDFRCDDCGLPHTYHRRDDHLRCHYCGSRIPVPSTCPECAAESLEPIGSGTERVEEQIRARYPTTTVEVLDRDTARRGEVAAVLERFGRGDSQIMVGTQMVSKGHHFPNVALTAVLLADSYLSFPDFRAVEKTYSLLTQLAGRGGRGERRGKVIIQSLHPDHYAIQAALHNQDQEFASQELRFRRMFHYPPYTRMTQIVLRDSNRRRGEAAMEDLASRIARHPSAAGVRVAGPAPAPFERLRGKWRFQLLLRHRSGKRVRQILETSLSDSSSLDLVVDVDPYELM